MDLILQGVPVNKSLKRSLIAFWKMGEAGGTRYSSKNPGIGPAAQFTVANSEYLSIADNASLSVGDIDFTIAAWVYMDSKPGSVNAWVVSKCAGGGVADTEYIFGYLKSIDRFQFYVSNGVADGGVNADVLGSPALATWYFLVAWHDSVANTINIQVNNGAVDSVAHTTGSQDTANAFKIGAAGTGGANSWDGRIDAVGFWKKVLSAAERTSLYNSGLGMAYRNLSGSLLTSLNAYWNLNEATGVRDDETANNNYLTDNNTVTQAIGVAGGNSLGEANTVTQAAGKIGNAGQFTAANNEYLATPDNTDLSTGDIDFTIAAWVYLDSIPASGNRPIVVKGTMDGTGANDEYALYYNKLLDRFRFFIANGTTFNVLNASTFGSPSTATWYFLVAWHDTTANTINIQINNGTVDSAATTITPQNGTGVFNIGQYGTGVADATFYMDGRIDAVGFWKRVLTAAERTKLYRGGLGREFPF